MKHQLLTWLTRKCLWCLIMKDNCHCMLLCLSRQSGYVFDIVQLSYLKMKKSILDQCINSANKNTNLSCSIFTISCFSPVLISARTGLIFNKKQERCVARPRCYSIPPHSLPGAGVRNSLFFQWGESMVGKRLVLLQAFPCKLFLCLIPYAAYIAAVTINFLVSLSFLVNHSYLNPWFSAFVLSILNSIPVEWEGEGKGGVSEHQCGFETLWEN